MGSVGAISIAIRPPRPIFTFLLICFSLSTGAVLMRARIRSSGQKYWLSHSLSCALSKGITASQ
ncbi:Uncharacterised protein (plasmid) [Klebsiella aerogenes]|nr:Uncharacterised protein [Klebsiella aerogenes]